MEYEKEARILENEDQMDTEDVQEVSFPLKIKGNCISNNIFFLLWDDFVLLVISSKHSGGGG